MAPSKYIMTPPEELHPYVTIPTNSKSEHDIPDTSSSTQETTESVYPDFEPWRHTKEEDQIFLNFISKGYYTTTKVGFESISARSSLKESVPKLSDRLSSQFSNILKLREETINKIPSNAPSHLNILSGPEFTLPNRVTLTDNRREAWLQDLSSPYVSLQGVSGFIPHGLKKRQVIEQCYTKRMPLRRAIWLIKCCYVIEVQHLMQKGPNVDSETIYKEWTKNFVHILEKLIFEMQQYYLDQDKLNQWKLGLAYFLKLLGNCYSLNLLDKNLFHKWIVDFLSKVESFEFLPIALHILTIFWDDILNDNYPNGNSDAYNDTSSGTKFATGNCNNFLVSKLVEILLHKYYVISNVKSMINDERYIVNDLKKNDRVKESLLSALSSLIVKLFQEQSVEGFLFFPSFWDLYKPYLVEIISKSSISDDSEVKKRLEIISYKNETLKNANFLTNDRGSSILASHQSQNQTPESTAQTPTSATTTTTATHYFAGVSDALLAHTKKIRIPHVDTNFTVLLDSCGTDFDWPQYIEQNPLGEPQIVQLVLWSIHASRATRYESGQLCTRILLFQINSLEGFPEYEIEDIVWSLVFQIAKLDQTNLHALIDLDSMYHLLNLLIMYGIIKVSTYIRKIISSGIMYIQDSDDKIFHSELLVNLKISPLVRNQYNMVLRNVMEYDPTFYENYNFDNLLKSADEMKEVILAYKNDSTDLTLSSGRRIPYSVRIMLAEWYLNQLCSDLVLQPVNREALWKSFNVFFLELQVSHHFYKWIEFIVYHQLLNDIETLVLLVDILLRYKRLFSQFINDHILFMKTFIFIYNKILKERDSYAYQITSLMPFWRFFMKNFSVALLIDVDLRAELTNVYEEEKVKETQLEQNKIVLLRTIYPDRSNNDENLQTANFNPAEVFQINIKTVLTCSKTKNDLEKFKRSKFALHALRACAIREYKKQLSIFLKRKNFDRKELICLISNNLLTLEQIKNAIGPKWVLDVFVFQTDLKSDMYSTNWMFYESCCDDYIRSNYQSILTTCVENINEYYTLLLNILVRYGSRSAFTLMSGRAIVSLLRNSSVEYRRILNDLLHFNESQSPLEDTQAESTIIETESEEDGEEDNTNEHFNVHLALESRGESKVNDIGDVSVYSVLDFTNLWIFQIYTNYRLQEIIQNSQGRETPARIKSYLVAILQAIDHDEIFTELFNLIEDTKVIETLVKVLEQNFFENVLRGEPMSREFLVITTRTIIALCKIVAKETSLSLPLTPEGYDTLRSVVSHCNSQNMKPQLQILEGELDIILKVMTIHQTSIQQYVVERLQYHGTKTETIKFIDDLFGLYDKVSFNLRFKLILYEFLASMKSYCLYVSSTGDKTRLKSPSDSATDDGDNIGNGYYFNYRDVGESLYPQSSSIKFQIPKKLLKLPPFQISSFVKTFSNNSRDDTLDLGLTPLSECREDPNTEEVQNEREGTRWFIFDKKESCYVSKLTRESYYNINNYQTSSETASGINNSCFNLSLFNASYDRRNPM